MKRIIIFRFDRKPAICRNRLRILQLLNPAVPIYGIYGGNEKSYFLMHKYTSPFLKHIYKIKNRPALWKWINFDLALRDWYRSVGHKVDFDMAHIIEWDMLFTDPLEKVYSHIRANEVGTTGLVALKKVEKGWWWTTHEPFKTQWKNLLVFVRKKYRYNNAPFASVGPGLCLPRIFLKRYSEAEVPELAHDELRVPLYAQIFNLRLKDTLIKKHNPEKIEEKFFNCSKTPIKPAVVRRENKKKNGRRAFHPYRTFFQTSKS